ncbi:MAG: metallophosphoesterase [Alphaproteobacteria bacterium]|nr:metallophosphoesterase [Alphaproteobacteria bacterium]
MGFLIVYLIIGTLCSLFSGYSFTARADYGSSITILIYGVFLAAWLSPLGIWHVKRQNGKLSIAHTIAIRICHLLLGMAFLMFCLLIIRDFVWYTLYILGIGKIPSPFEITAARTANMITLLILFLCTAYSLYAAEKMPRVLHFKYCSTRIKQTLKILVISDWHINRLTPLKKIEKQISYFNNLHPDIILMPGDIADDSKECMQKQLRIIKKLRAPQGICFTLGNHEIYHNPYAWEAEFAAIGWKILHNSGIRIESARVFIGGVPDYTAFKVDLTQAVSRAHYDDYRIVLSHSPVIFRQIKPKQIDLMVAGHTHGGQIFPFNLLSKLGNAGFIAGEYRLNDAVLILSRGAGYWGPPMRLGAPSDVILITLEPQC